jgi:hypothetical protein
MLLRKTTRWFASLPISIVALHSIMVGTITSAAKYDGWITWGHEASVPMVMPIVVWAMCGSMVRRRRL